MVDKVEIFVAGGDGGSGRVSFRHEKFIPFGGPDGGDGGSGGSVYVIADRRVNSLDNFRQRQRFKAASGGRGGRQRKHGSKGDDLELTVPQGTMVFIKDGDREVLIADLKQHGEKVLVARGGKGGLGNTHFATPKVQAPKTATPGEPGEERWLVLELKTISDVVIIGYPNVGKSSLLAAMTNSRPRIADYPFTTQELVLGVVEVGTKTVTVAEIPALIEGAHLGKGLGNEFLRHAERAKLLLFLLDGTSPSIADDRKNLRAELAVYKPSLAQKPRLVVVNKTDLPEVQTRLAEIKQLLGLPREKVFFISATTRQGVPELVAEIVQMLAEVKEEPAISEEPVALFQPKPKAKRSKVG